MPLDPSIISGIKPAQFDMAQFSPMNALTSAMKFRQADEESQLNALKRKEYENTRLQQENLNKFVRGGEGVAAADFNLPETRRNLLGYGKPGADFSEALSKQETAALTQRETQFKVQKAREDFVNQAMRNTSGNPSNDNIMKFKAALLANPLFNDEEKAEMAAGADRILAMPVGERAAFMSSQGASASELKPPAPAAPPSMVAEYNFAKSPEGGNFKGDYQSFVTARAAAGRAPAPPRPEQPPIAVVGPDGKSIYVSREEALRNRMTPAPTAGQDAKPLNENQANATAYGLRMKEANSILEDLAGKGVLKGAVIERTPLIGRALGQSLPSVLGGTSSAQQQVNQAKSNFITAVLRKESGAVISDSEFEREDQKYFPQINDNKEVIKQKEKARKLAIQAIEVQAGPGAKNIREYNPRAGAAGAGVDTSNPLLR